MKQVSPSISLDLGVLMTHMIASFIPTLWGTKTYWIIETCHWASLLSLVCVCVLQYTERTMGLMRSEQMV